MSEPTTEQSVEQTGELVHALSEDTQPYDTLGESPIDRLDLDIADFDEDEIAVLVNPDPHQVSTTQKIDILEPALNESDEGVNPRFVEFAARRGLRIVNGVKVVEAEEDTSPNEKLLEVGLEYVQLQLYKEERLEDPTLVDFIGQDEIDALSFKYADECDTILRKSVIGRDELVQRVANYFEMSDYMSWLYSEKGSLELATALKDDKSLREQAEYLEHNFVPFELAMRAEAKDQLRKDRFQESFRELLGHSIFFPEEEPDIDELDIETATLRGIEMLDKLAAEREALIQAQFDVIPNDGKRLPRIGVETNKRNFRLSISGQKLSITIREAWAKLRHKMEDRREKRNSNNTAAEGYTATEVILYYSDKNDGLYGDDLRRIIEKAHPKLRLNRTFKQVLASYNKDPDGHTEKFYSYAEAESTAELREIIFGSVARQNFIASNELGGLFDEKGHIKEGIRNNE